MASGSESPKFVRALRRMRPMLTRELPDTATLLKRPELKDHFTAYEANTILSQSLPSQRAEKFIEILEFKSYQVYQKFVFVLKILRTDVAIRLEGVEREVSAASMASSPRSNECSPERKCKRRRISLLLSLGIMQTDRKHHQSSVQSNLLVLYNIYSSLTFFKERRPSIRSHTKNVTVHTCIAVVSKDHFETLAVLRPVYTH